MGDFLFTISHNLGRTYVHTSFVTHSIFWNLFHPNMYRRLSGTHYFQDYTVRLGTYRMRFHNLLYSY